MEDRLIIRQNDQIFQARNRPCCAQMLIEVRIIRRRQFRVAGDYHQVFRVGFLGLLGEIEGAGDHRAVVDHDHLVVGDWVLAVDIRRDFAQGMLVSIPLFLDDLPGRPSAAALTMALAAHYGPTGPVRVVASADAAKIEPESLNQTNDLELHVFADEAKRQAVLVAKLDNLGKGASGAAVQNMALMLGL